MAKEYLTAAGSILTIEARHNTYLLGANKGNPVPAPFDTPLDFDEVYSIASAFIVSCPKSNPTLPVKAFPPLTVQGSAAVASGETIHVMGSWTDGTYAIVLAGLMTYPVQVVDNKFQFPADPVIKGQVFRCFDIVDNRYILSFPRLQLRLTILSSLDLLFLWPIRVSGEFSSLLLQ
jgi:hypothetical protein